MYNFHVMDRDGWWAGKPSTSTGGRKVTMEQDYPYKKTGD